MPNEMIPYTKDANGITLKVKEGEEWQILDYTVGLEMCEWTAPPPSDFVLNAYSDMYMRFFKECTDDANPLQAERCEQLCLIKSEAAGCKPLTILDEQER